MKSKLLIPGLWVLSVCFSMVFVGCLKKTVDTHGGIRMVLNVADQSSDKDLINETLKILESRLSAFTSQSFKVALIPENEILAEIPLATDTALFRRLLTEKGRSSVTEAYSYDECKVLLEPLMLKFKSMMPQMAVADRSALIAFFNMPSEIAYLPVIGASLKGDTAFINKVILNDTIRALLPIDMELKWGIEYKKNLYPMYATRPTTLSRRISDGGLKKAEATTSAQTGLHELYMEFNEAEAWSQFTRNNINRQIPILFGETVMTAPNIQSQLMDGTAIISGNFNEKEIRFMEAVLHFGPYPGNVKIKSIELIKPTK